MKRLFLLSLVLALPLCAQYQIDWSTHDAGGGASAGGAYTLVGTAGQPDAGSHAGGTYTLAGGFWGAFGVEQPEPIPLLRIEVNGVKVLLAWPNPSTGYQLQETSTLTSPNWAFVNDAPSIVGGEKQVSVLLEAAPRYYRLRKP